MGSKLFEIIKLSASCFNISLFFFCLFFSFQALVNELLSAQNPKQKQYNCAMKFKFSKLNIIIVAGFCAIIGILIAQILWTREAFDLEEKKFSGNVRLALLEVVKSLYEGTNHELPPVNPVRKMANDYFVVNVENDFEPQVLEFYLKKELQKFGIQTNFEYALYNCESDKMVYGDFVQLSDHAPETAHQIEFPKHKSFVYYFAIRFPEQTSYLLGNFKVWIFATAALVLILLIYLYSVVMLLQQKRYGELQRDFINNMTHEFKTPLSSILLASNYLEKKTQSPEHQKLNAYSKIIVDQSLQLNKHIENLLTMAKSEHGGMQICVERIRFTDLLNEVEGNLRLKVPDLVIKRLFDADFKLVADPFHFKNVVFNIIDNSIKYCNQSPEISIAVEESASAILLRFGDNGIGVHTKALPHVFDKFFRENTGKRNEVRGFGLGLHYVKRVANLHKWKITALHNKPSGLIIQFEMKKHES